MDEKVKEIENISTLEAKVKELEEENIRLEGIALLEEKIVGQFKERIKELEEGIRKHKNTLIQQGRWSYFDEELHALLDGGK